MTRAVILSAVRTPVGKFLGKLKPLTAPQLGAMVIQAVLERTGVRPEQVDEVLMGQVVQAGSGQNPARQAALGAGLPPTISATTINQVCGSGLKAVMLAAQAIGAGDAELVVAGGQESMSNAPYLLTSAREGYRLGHGQVIDANICDGLWCALSNIHMGETGEIVGEKYHIGRQEQDQFALESHRRAIAALDSGKFRREIVPVTIPSAKVDGDEGPRRDTNLAALSTLRPAFRQQGTVTAGNAPGLSDGAAAVLVASEEKARQLGIAPRALIEAYATSGVEPRLVMMAPVPAVRRVWELTGWRAEDVDLYEINEAFSVAAIAVMRELGLDQANVNVHGGAVALGHPIGCTGARILTTLLHALEDRSARRGIAALCLGGGNAVAMAISRQ